MSAGVALTNFTLTLDNLVVGWGIGYPEIFKKGGCPQIREGVYLSGFPTLVGREDAMETVAPRDGGLVEEEVDDQSMQDNTGCNGDKEKNSPQQSFETLDRPNTEENWRREIFEKHKMHQIEEKMLIPFKYGFSRKVTISRSRIRIKYKHEELNKTSLYPKHVRKLLEEHPDRFQGLICENFNFNQQIFNLPGEHITYCSTEKQGEAKGKQNGPFKRSKSMPGMSMKRSKKDSSNLDAEDFNSEDEIARIFKTDRDKYYFASPVQPDAEADLVKL